MKSVLDPIGQRVEPGLFEHVDGRKGGFPKPKARTEASPAQGTTA